MNQEQDKELDVLLRRYAKREEQRVKAALFADEGNGKKISGFPAETEHLDADAMNAYAENALPVSARTRYAEHLVDCDACRKVVTQLALTANPIGFEKEEGTTVTATTTQTWRERLLSFLTYPSLKLAGSVAAVLFIASITFVIWQRNDKSPQSSANYEARNQDNGQAVAYTDDSSKPKNGNVANSPQQTTKEESKTTTNNTSAGGSESLSTKSGESDAKKEQSEVAKPSDERKDAPKNAEKDDSNVATNQPQPTPVNTQGSGPSASQNQVNTQTQQETVAQQRQNPGKSGGPNRSRDANDGRAAKSASPPPAPEPATESKDKPESGEKVQEKQKKAVAKKTGNDSDVALAGNRAKREAATRTVSGKKFYRIDDAWVDAAYKNSAITIIKRGSEQYDSLEEGLRSIAEQLGGEVIVIWKGRAYKIR